MRRFTPGQGVTTVLMALAFMYMVKVFVAAGIGTFTKFDDIHLGCTDAFQTVLVDTIKDTSEMARIDRQRAHQGCDTTLRVSKK